MNDRLSAPPPPPLPVITPQNYGGSTFEEANKFTKSSISQEDFYKELTRLCALELKDYSSKAVDKEPYGMIVICEPLLHPILQSGPTCGLIAMIEAMNMLGVDLKPENVLEYAVKLGITKKGEMFSAEFMKDLANTELKANSSQNTACVVKENEPGRLKEAIVNSILNSCPAIIPYDADFNHRPALRKGHAAHWAVVHGIAMVKKLNEIKISSAVNSSQNITLLTANNITQQEKEWVTKSVNDSMLYVVAHQGKSVHPGLWEITSLLASNQNLKEISPKITIDCQSYVLHDMKKELANQIVVFEKSS